MSTFQDLDLLFCFFKFYKFLNLCKIIAALIKESKI